MNVLFPIPTGLLHSAQGCSVGGTTLGNVVHYFSQPQQGCINRWRANGGNPVGVKESRPLAALRDALPPKQRSGELRGPAASGSMEVRA